MQPLAQQIAAFLLTMILGMVMGLFYDSYRVIRNIWRPKEGGTILGDAVFWVFITIFAFIYLIFSTWGEVRVYVFLAISLGGLLYFKFFSKYICFIFLYIFDFVIKLFRTFIRIIKVPLMLCWMVLLLPFRFLGVFMLAVYKGSKKLGHILRFKSPPQEPPQN